MELEYKWMLPTGCTFAQLTTNPRIADLIQHTEVFTMCAHYYDTPDALFHRMHGALRLRRENETSICCMKLTREKTGARALREEYEVAADSIAEGLQRLPEAGAPRAICAQIHADTLVELCCTDFRRHAYTLAIPSHAGACIAELAMDRGWFRRGTTEQAFTEIELEYKSGDEAAFLSYCDALAQDCQLIPQPLSKLARAMALPLS